MEPNIEPRAIGKIAFQHDRMCLHATLCINYTSYDVWRQQDIVNPGTLGRFILLPANTTDDSNAHPFLEAKVLGFYHAKVLYCGRLARSMDFLWVRWLDYDKSRPGGWNASRLDPVGYQRCRNDTDILESFGFVDPANVIWAAHLIPDFCSGATLGLLDPNLPSLAHDDPEFGDWEYHFVNRFVALIKFSITLLTNLPSGLLIEICWCGVWAVLLVITIRALPLTTQLRLKPLIVRAYILAVIFIIGVLINRLIV